MGLFKSFIFTSEQDALPELVFFMAAIIQTGFPGYSAVNNTSGGPSAVKSAGRVTNVEQHDAALAAERSGKLNLTQFGLIKLPREVLILQDEKDAKIKGTRLGDQVQSSSKADLDEERTLTRAADSDNPLKIDPLKPRKEKVDADERKAKEQNSQNGSENAKVNKEADTTKKMDVPETAKKEINQQDVAAFAELVKSHAAPEKGRSEKTRSDDLRRAATEAKSEDREEAVAAPQPSVVGSPTVVYATVQNAADNTGGGENLSVLA